MLNAIGNASVGTTAMDNEFKIIELDHVYHVGTLDPSNLGLNSGSGSLEGRCLSVSLCPNAWVGIARLGGYDLHKLTKSGGRFLDVHAIMSDPELTDRVVDWAIKDGLAIRKQVFRAWSYDDENDDWSYLLAETRSAAIHEINIDDNEGFDPDSFGPEGRPLIEPFDIVAGTEKLWKASGATLGPADDAMDLVIICFASESASGLADGPIDGVWWNEAYDPDRLSAPRGGILPERLAEWAAEACSFNDVEDVTALHADDAGPLTP
jgi:hypothetical protein